jgi:acyl-[acyl-carrier-protein]-phospholipid O-acyltransferase/long-chain-fatty-acid--[acyl-carrier-protein] ligase
MFKIVGAINYLFVVFLNAFTDLGHKIIIQNTIFKVYDGPTQIVLTAIVNALILLPFILVFSPSGFLADRFAKNKIMEYAALFAIFITLGITYAYYHGEFYLAFALTFVLALQSAIYGPAKYGYIKELFGDRYISGGNGATQAVTTVAILGGIIFYTVLFEGMYQESLQTKDAILEAVAPLGWFLVVGSVIEWFLASKLPNKLLERSMKSFEFKRYISGFYLRKNLKTLTRKREIFEAVIALGLFWSISQVVLAIFGEYAKTKLGVTNTIYVQGVMALAGIGIVIGSILAAKLSKYFINMGLSAFGAIGITLIVWSVPFMSSMKIIAFAFMLFGVLSGFVLVPLNSRIQHLASSIHLGTIIAANNFIQNIFMFSFLLLTTLFAYFGMDAEILFYLMGCVGIYLVVLLFRRYYIDIFWTFISIVISLRYKVIYHGLENIPQNRAVLLLGNHVSWIDWILLQLPLERRINYMIDREIYHWKYWHSFFQKGEAIPLSAHAFKDAMREAHKRLKQGRIVALFPEGAITKDGEIHEFHRGYELIEKDYNGNIIPFYIDKGVFSTIFSKYKVKNATLNPFKRQLINIYFGMPLPKDTKSEELRELIVAMKDKYETQ